MYYNQSSNAGHPNVDVVLMFKTRSLKVCYNLSDIAIEHEINNHLSLWYLPNRPDSIPDNSAI
ncbi:MAG: transposase [Methanocorpusculum parvum]|nr:transposase [Methanocorpusculum parvum]